MIVVKIVIFRVVKGFWFWLIVKEVMILVFKLVVIVIINGLWFEWLLYIFNLGYFC